MKRKDFSNLKIEVQNKKNMYFEHENYIAGIPPFLRGIYSFSKHQYSINKNKQNTVTKLDLSDLDFNNKINEVLENKTETSLISISNNTEINSEIQIAKLLLKAHKLFSDCIKNGIKIDSIATQISFSWCTTNILPFEIAKIRATRLLWAKMINQFQPKNIKSLALQIHIEGGDYLSSLIAITGNTQYDSKNNTFLKQNSTETFIGKTTDPWAGSTVIEKLTEDFTLKTWNLFQHY